MMQQGTKPVKKRVVFTAGTWDLFHVGHLNLIKKSKELGDFLIVAVSTDELVASYKKGLLVIPFDERVAILESCKYVDKVIKQSSLIELKQLKEYDPDIITIGDDWKGKQLSSLEWFKNQPNKKVVYLPYTSHVSSTKIKETIRKSNF